MENMNGQANGGAELVRRAWHWACCILPAVSFLMWLAAIVFTVLSWVSALNETGEVWGIGPQWYIWNVLIFGILALYGGRKRIGGHGMCGCRPGCDCKNGSCVCK